MERGEKDRIVKRVYIGECSGSCSVDVRQARRMVGVCEGECMGHSPGDEP